MPRISPRPKTATVHALMLTNVRVVADATRDDVLLLFSTPAGREHSFALRRDDACMLAAEIKRVAGEED